MSARNFPGRRRSPTSGFTLLEVLVALAIFALAAVVLGSAYVNVLTGYDIAQHANQRHEDLEFARTQFLAIADRTEAEKGDEFDAANGRHVRWSAQINPTQTADLFDVTFTCEVSDPSAKEPETTTENFMVLRPTWSDPTERTALLANAKDRILKLQGAAP